MNRYVIGMLAILAVALSLCIPTISAQTIARANVPFAFTVGQTELPAGTYVVSSLSDSAIVITNRSTGTSVLSLFRSEQAKNNDRTAKLVFHKYGDRYFLSQVGRGFGGSLIQLPTSKQEREAQIQTARWASQKEVAVGAN
jgi:hypothetical protein